MEYNPTPRKVTLKTDLTKYDSRCVKDSIGVTIPYVKLSMWGDTDRFVAVHFDNGAKLDVLISSLTFSE